jgi:hypothetical protein
MKKIIYSFFFVILLSLNGCQENDNPVIVPNEPGYKEYVGYIGQSNNETPVINILNNTIGDIQWSRVKTGYYKGTLKNLFQNDRVFCIIQAPMIKEQTNSLRKYNNDEIVILTFDNGALADNVLSNTAIEIRIYK